ncbi:TMM81 protein, partial [Donacobius atricapilla]|nr:TMM81 protein [Donacobius atricapilla]
LPSGSELPWGSEPVPLGLKAAVLVASTPCSVTCGLGVREERLCQVSPAGQLRNCSLVRSRCLSDWICGLRHLGVPQGKPFRLLCLSPDDAGPEGWDFGYSWSFARGLITTNDLLFRPFRNPGPSLSFWPALESHSGTYRCDVQVLSSFQLVKRIYFGLRVIPGDLVPLDFQKSLAWGQEVPGSGEGRERRRGPWERRGFHEAVLGVGSGAILGILLGLGICRRGRTCR